MTAFSDLTIFARVARTGNMSAAGREMGISPAVVSKRISLLEDRLGARLFQRTTRQLTLTETGEGYFKRVLDILNLVEEAEDFVSRRNTQPRGKLKITAPTTFCRLHIAPHLAEFVSNYPDIQLDFHLTDSYVDIVRDGYDLAIRIGELPDSSLVARKLSPDRRVICAAPSYLKKAGTPKNVVDLDLHNCLLTGGQETWRLEGPEGEHLVRVKGSIRSDSAELLRDSLLSGLGIGLRSLWEVAPEIRSGALKVILPDYVGSSNVAVFAVYPSREFMPAKVHAFIEFLAGHFAIDPQWEKSLDTARPKRRPPPSGKSPPRRRAMAS
jgi:DNA-binding transcriptional LysR family regulator